MGARRLCGQHIYLACESPVRPTARIVNWLTLLVRPPKSAFWPV